jgi:predicted unusual protein kinase regulating ubiquinone biosynthesis (AarF/ABC1/UbiB family)
MRPEIDFTVEADNIDEFADLLADSRHLRCRSCSTPRRKSSS